MWCASRRLLTATSATAAASWTIAAWARQNAGSSSSSHHHSNNNSNDSHLMDVLNGEKLPDAPLLSSTTSSPSATSSPSSSSSSADLFSLVPILAVACETKVATTTTARVAETLKEIRIIMDTNNKNEKEGEEKKKFELKVLSILCIRLSNLSDQDVACKFIYDVLLDSLEESFRAEVGGGGGGGNVDISAPKAAVVSALVVTTRVLQGMTRRMKRSTTKSEDDDDDDEGTTAATTNKKDGGEVTMKAAAEEDLAASTYLDDARKRRHFEVHHEFLLEGCLAMYTSFGNSITPQDLSQLVSTGSYLKEFSSKLGDQFIQSVLKPLMGRHMARILNSASRLNELGSIIQAFHKLQYDDTSVIQKFVGAIPKTITQANLFSIGGALQTLHTLPHAVIPPKVIERIKEAVQLRVVGKIQEAKVAELSMILSGCSRLKILLSDQVVSLMIKKFVGLSAFWRTSNVMPFLTGLKRLFPKSASSSSSSIPRTVVGELDGLFSELSSAPNDAMNPANLKLEEITGLLSIAIHFDVQGVASFLSQVEPVFEKALSSSGGGGGGSSSGSLPINIGDVAVLADLLVQIRNVACVDDKEKSLVDRVGNTLFEKAVGTLTRHSSMIDGRTVMVLSPRLLREFDTDSRENEVMEMVGEMQRAILAEFPRILQQCTSTEMGHIAGILVKWKDQQQSSSSLSHDFDEAVETLSKRFYSLASSSGASSSSPQHAAAVGVVEDNNVTVLSGNVLNSILRAVMISRANRKDPSSSEGEEEEEDREEGNRNFTDCVSLYIDKVATEQLAQVVSIVLATPSTTTAGNRNNNNNNKHQHQRHSSLTAIIYRIGTRVCDDIDQLSARDICLLAHSISTAAEKVIQEKQQQKQPQQQQVQVQDGGVSASLAEKKEDGAVDDNDEGDVDVTADEDDVASSSNKTDIDDDANDDVYDGISFDELITAVFEAFGDRLCTKVQKQSSSTLLLKELEAREYAMLLQGFRRVEVCHYALMTNILKHISAHPEDMPPLEMTQILFSFAKLGMWNERVMNKLIVGSMMHRIQSLNSSRLLFLLSSITSSGFLSRSFASLAGGGGGGGRSAKLEQSEQQHLGGSVSTLFIEVLRLLQHNDEKREGGTSSLSIQQSIGLLRTMEFFDDPPYKVLAPHFDRVLQHVVIAAATATSSSSLSAATEVTTTAPEVDISAAAEEEEEDHDVDAINEKKHEKRDTSKNHKTGTMSLLPTITLLFRTFNRMTAHAPYQLQRQLKKGRGGSQQRRVEKVQTMLLRLVISSSSTLASSLNAVGMIDICSSLLRFQQQASDADEETSAILAQHRQVLDLLWDISAQTALRNSNPALTSNVIFLLVCLELRLASSMRKKDDEGVTTSQHQQDDDPVVDVCVRCMSLWKDIQSTNRYCFVRDPSSSSSSSSVGWHPSNWQTPSLIRLLEAFCLALYHVRNSDNKKKMTQSSLLLDIVETVTSKVSSKGTKLSPMVTTRIALAQQLLVVAKGRRGADDDDAEKKHQKKNPLHVGQQKGRSHHSLQLIQSLVDRGVSGLGLSSSLLGLMAVDCYLMQHDANDDDSDEKIVTGAINAFSVAAIQKLNAVEDKRDDVTAALKWANVAGNLVHRLEERREGGGDEGGEKKDKKSITTVPARLRDLVERM